MKKLTSLLLVLTLIATMTSGAIAAPASKDISMEKTALALPTVEDLASLPTLPEGSPRTTYVSTLSEAADMLRKGMVQRQEVVEVYVCTDDWSDENLQNMSDEILAYAMIHTGVPNEGDYLLWTLDSGYVGADGFVEGDLAMITFTYELYYTSTAQEEQTVDALVRRRLSKLDLDAMTDYEKLLALYSELCATTAYRAMLDDRDRTAYGALELGNADTLGFALTTYRLTLELGLDCRIILGKYNNTAHYWNIVQLGDLYYNMDASKDAGTEDLPHFLCSDASYPSHKRDSIFASADFYDHYPMAEQDYVRPCAHDYVSEVIAPDCDDQGCTVYTCTKCADSYTTDIVPALGCDYGPWELVQESSCTKDEIHVRTCARCGNEDTKRYHTIGHQYRDGACTVCGKELEEGLTVPAAPTILSCYSKLQTSVKVTWTTQEGVEGYELWRGTDPDDVTTWNRVKTIADPSKDRYTNQDLTEGVTYYYKVRAYITASDGSKVYSDFSNIDHMPAAVVWDGPYSNATFRIRLRWQEVGGSHGYQIWRQEPDGSWKIVKTLGDKGNTLTNDQGNTTAYSNTGLTAGDTHTYKMRAFWITEDGRKIFGAYSDEFTVAVKPEAPALTVTCPKQGRAAVSWDAVNGAAGYQIWMATGMDGSFKIVKSITDGSTAYTKYDLKNGIYYRFKIRAYTEVDGKKTFGDYSEIVTILVE